MPEYEKIDSDSRTQELKPLCWMLFKMFIIEKFFLDEVFGY